MLDHEEEDPRTGQRYFEMEPTGHSSRRILIDGWQGTEPDWKALSDAAEIINSKDGNDRLWGQGRR